MDTETTRSQTMTETTITRTMRSGEVRTITITDERVEALIDKIDADGQPAGPARVHARDEVRTIRAFVRHAREHAAKPVPEDKGEAAHHRVAGIQHYEGLEQVIAYADQMGV